MTADSSRVSVSKIENRKTECSNPSFTLADESPSFCKPALVCNVGNELQEMNTEKSRGRSRHQATIDDCRSRSVSKTWNGRRVTFLGKEPKQSKEGRKPSAGREYRASMRIKQCTEDRKARLSLRRLNREKNIEKRVIVNDIVKSSKEDDTVVCSRKSIEKLVEEITKLNKTTEDLQNLVVELKSEVFKS